MSTKKVYTYAKEILAIVAENNYRTVNMPLDNRNLNVYKGSTTRLYFQLHNYDGRPLNLEETDELLLIVKDTTHNQIVLEKTLTKLDEVPPLPGTSRPSVNNRDPNKGKYYVDIFHGDIVDLEHLMYTWSLAKQKEVIADKYDRTYLYLDQQFGVSGDFIVGERPYQVFTPSEDLGDPESWVEFHSYEEKARFKSSALVSAAQKHQEEGMQTFAYELENYSGKVIIRGTLENIPPTTDDNWFYVAIGDSGEEFIHYDEATTTEHINVVVNAMWLRFEYEPDDVDFGDLKNNEGKIVRVLYRS